MPVGASGLPYAGPERFVAAGGESGSRAPFLLTMGAYHGTLAATRCLGANAIPVVIADPALFAPARWSRFATGRLFCPPVRQKERFVRWLLDFGRRHPGHVLYPTSDDVAWIFALHRAELATDFHLYQPPVEVIYQLLNKRRLLQACAEVGIDTPQTWFPRDATALRRLETELSYPVLIKPQTQILYWPHAKGMVAKSREELSPTYKHLLQQAAYEPALLAYDPEVAQLMVQAYFPGAADSIYNLSGFIDETGELFAIRASRKVLQRPRQLGVGLCFEEAAAAPVLAGKLRALCRRVGYHGVFEVEFIEEGGRAMLIDFNPRFYGQMAFDVARDLPLPLMVYEAALGRRHQLRAAVQKAGEEVTTEPRGRVYCNRLEFHLLLRLERLAGNLASSDVARWKTWLREHSGAITDGTLDPEDRGPAFAHLTAEVLQYLRHPRSLIRQLSSWK